MPASTQTTVAHLVAQTLKHLNVSVLFGLVGYPVVQIAEACLNSGIRFIGLRNEQAAVYAACAYGYLTGKPGVALLVGGPGVWHGMAGVANAVENGWPLVVLAGSSESHLVGKGAFQELDAVSLARPYTKLTVRPALSCLEESVPRALASAWRTAASGRPGPAFIDLPADVITEKVEMSETSLDSVEDVIPISKGVDEAQLSRVAGLIKSAETPLILIGKGAAYARAERPLRELIDKTNIPFLPSPMGKGVVPDSHPANVSSARSAVLKSADVVLVLGARLNWIFHFGEPPKWSPKTKFIQIDIEPQEIGRNAGDASLGIVGDVGDLVSKLTRHLSNWRYSTSSPYLKELKDAELQNKAKESRAEETRTKDGSPLSLHRAYRIIKNVLHSFAPPEEGRVCYVAEGANTMDISRTAFPLEHPRLRLDAGTNGLMGCGLAYAIAAWEAYNSRGRQAHGASRSKKKIVALEGDSAFGFSGMEVETMARYGMDILIFVMNNSGIYHGDADKQEEWNQKQHETISNAFSKISKGGGLRSWTLGYNVRYEKVAEMCGGKGVFVRTEQELEKAAREGYEADCPVVVNVAIESGKGAALMEIKAGIQPQFSWQANSGKPAKKLNGPKL